MNILINEDYLETKDGIFTSNTHLGLNAQEVYEKWLYDKENPQPMQPTLEEQVELLQEENKALNERLNEYEIMMTSMYKTLIDKDVVTLSEVPKSITKKL